MASGPEPLAAGTQLEGRFTIQRVLGRGGFGITYLAEDAKVGDRCVVKELTAAHAVRIDSGALQFPGEDAHQVSRRFHQFVKETEALRRLSDPGIPRLRTAFQANGTSYVVTDYAEGCRSLDTVLHSEGRLSGAAVRDLAEKLAPILSRIHRAGILHRDLKPSNILVLPSGKVLLIDFGSARSWFLGGGSGQTVQYTPGFAPLEQMSVHGRQSAATDVFGLSATLYNALVGSPPPDVTDRLAGVELADLGQLVSAQDAGLQEAILAGLNLKLNRRPQTIEDWLDFLHAADERLEHQSLAELDRKAVLMRRTRFDRMGCPACESGALVVPKPAKPDRCFVCRTGAIVRRKITPGQCPNCRTGFWKHVHVGAGLPPSCPACHRAALRSTKSAPWKPKRVSCPECQAAWTVSGGLATDDATGASATWAEWWEASGRSLDVERCSACHAQFDRMPDDTYKMVSPLQATHGHHRLLRADWELVANGFEPGSGNADCASCGADYWIAEGDTTLLDSAKDPYGIAAAIVGQRISPDQARWVATGKLSGAAGLLCNHCPTEFDDMDGHYELIRTPHARLRRHAGEILALPDWQRLALGLPLFGQEHELDEAMEFVAVREYREGALPYDARKPERIWKSPARLNGRDGQLTITTLEMTFAQMLRRETLPHSDIRALAGEGDEILILDQREQEWHLQIEPQVLRCKLDSGPMEIELTAEDLAARWRLLIAPVS